ncbi:MAG: PSD1 and planctomycete cytochrome C domain-containing protein [Pirellula sp.]
MHMISIALKLKAIARSAFAVGLVGSLAWAPWAIAQTATEAPEAVEQKLTPEQLDFFETKIRPVLIENCYRCHSASEQSVRGGLSVDNRDALLAGGESGAAIVPGDLENSILWHAINYRDYRMPPRGKLPAAVIADFKTWIEMGAPDPRVNQGAVVNSKVTAEDIEKGKSFWSFVEPKKVEPVVDKYQDWGHTPIDRYVVSKWEEQQVEPNEDCDPNTLVRRLTFDLTGLPPSPEQRAEFLRDWKASPQDAIERLVDELLASEQYGQHWGRHWLDVARYAETSGKESDVTYPNAWRYRDYVIESFQKDKPYDRFIIEQVAGDLLSVSSDQQWNEHLIATGFLAIGPKSLAEQNPRQFQADLIDEQIDTTTRVVLGLSVGCARCHDHKFDPIPQSDYYALAGIFQSTETFYGGTRSIRNRQPSDWIRLPVADPDSSKPIMSPQDVADLKKELQERQQELAEARRAQRTGANNAVLNANILDQIVSQIRARISSVDDQGRPVSVCMGVQDRTTMRSARILVRGEIDQQAQEVPRGFVQVLGNLPKQLSPKSSGRLELAQWMVSKDNPLAARVMVNRIWQHLIGKGIVREPDNFGVSGPAPTHRDLLDYLAIDFMDNGWSIKHMIRSIATSRVYRISSAYDPERFEADPENLWIARANPKRLGAEAIRDSMLTASGSINLKPAKSSMFASFGPAVMGPNGPQNIPLIFAPNAINDDRAANLRRLLGGGMRNPTINQMEVANYHRSVYLPVGRNVLPRALDVFDFADPNSVTGTREVSNTAAQALYMMNNPFVLELSDAFARRVMQSTKDPQGRVDRAFQLAYGRSASTDEVNASLRFLRRAKESQDQVPADEALFKAWSQLCQALIAAAEFRIVN